MSITVFQSGPDTGDYADLDRRIRANKTTIIQVDSRVIDNSQDIDVIQAVDATTYPRRVEGTEAVVSSNEHIARGADAVDLTMFKLDPLTQNPVGSRSVSIGGNSNRVEGDGSACYSTAKGHIGSLSDKSVIVGGSDHTIQTLSGSTLTLDAAILGGRNNTITDSCNSSAMLGGDGSTLTQSRYCITAGGRTNTITDCAHTGVVAAETCGVSNGSNRALLTGSGNTAENVDDLVVSGVGNNANNCARSSILGGTGHTLNANDAAILGGTGSTNSGNLGVIMGGEECIVEKNCGRNVVGGFQCKVFDHEDGGSWNALCVGYQCEVKQNSHSCFISGAGNVVVDSDDTAIAGGFDNAVAGSHRAFIGGGQLNRVNAGSELSACVGSYNHINAVRGFALGNAAEINHGDSVVISCNGTTTREPTKRANQIYQFVKNQPSFRKNNITQYHFQVRLDSIELATAYVDIGYFNGSDVVGRMDGVLKAYGCVSIPPSSIHYHGKLRFAIDQTDGYPFNQVSTNGVPGSLGVWEDKLYNSQSDWFNYYNFDVSSSGVLKSRFEIYTAEAGTVLQSTTCVFTIVTDPGVEPPFNPVVIGTNSTASIVW